MVIGFLVMSGFLLGLFFEQRETLDVCRFFIGKMKRLLPIFLLSLLPCFLSRVVMHQTLMPLSPAEWGSVDLTAVVEWYNVPAWYMVVEFAMLLAAPFFFCLYKSRFGLAFCFILAVGYAAFLFSQVPYQAPFGCGLYFSPSARCWQFLTGVLAARLWCARKADAGRFAASLFGKIFGAVWVVAFLAAWGSLVVLKQEAQLHYLNYSFGFDACTAAFFAVLVPLAYQWRINGSPLFSRILVYAAVLTYPVYLFHVPLLKITRDVLAPLTGVQQAGVIGVAACCISIAVAAAVQKVQDRWIG